MTVPVRMEHTPKKIDMAFMVPHHVKDDTPDPTAADVKVVTVPRQLVYARYGECLCNLGVRVKIMSVLLSDFLL